MSSKITPEQVDAAIEQMTHELTTNPTPEAIAELREKYGVTFDITGTLVEVREPKRFRKAVEDELAEEAGEPKTTIKDVAQSVTAGASKTGEVILYGLVDAPIEGAKTAKQVTKVVASKTKTRLTEAHQRRLARAEQRKAAREERKAARAKAKAEAEACEKAAEESAQD